METKKGGNVMLFKNSLMKVGGGVPQHLTVSPLVILTRLVVGFSSPSEVMV